MQWRHRNAFVYARQGLRHRTKQCPRLRAYRSTPGPESANACRIAASGTAAVAAAAWLSVTLSISFTFHSSFSRPARYPKICRYCEALRLVYKTILHCSDHLLLSFLRCILPSLASVVSIFFASCLSSISTSYTHTKQHEV